MGTRFIVPLDIGLHGGMLQMDDSPLNAALRPFEATEANLVKLERVVKEMEAAIPEGMVYVLENPEYEKNCRSFDALWESLPKIDGWKPEIALMGLDEIAQNRLDASEIGESDCIISTERQIHEPFRQFREYRFRFDRKRRELIADSIDALISAVDGNLSELLHEFEPDSEVTASLDGPTFDNLKCNVDQIDSLLGSSVPRPRRWGDLRRHLHYGLFGDLRDIIQHDWPSVKVGLQKSFYGEKDPVPVGVEDLGTLVKQKPKGPVATKLKWDRLSPEEFERLMFTLISSERGYENPELLTRTNAPDRGRDLSVDRVYVDALGGTIRQRVIIQCRHSLTKSVSLADVTTLSGEMKLWGPPRVDVIVIATSCRFTTDAIAYIEKHNQTDTALRIEKWPESHLERLLASRPSIIAEFALR